MLSNAPCPAAALRAAAAYAALEAVSQGWLVARSTRSAASALQTYGEASSASRFAPPSSDTSPRANVAAPAPPPCSPHFGCVSKGAAGPLSGRPDSTAQTTPLPPHPPPCLHPQSGPSRAAPSSPHATTPAPGREAAATSLLVQQLEAAGASGGSPRGAAWPRKGQRDTAAVASAAVSAAVRAVSEAVTAAAAAGWYRAVRRGGTAEVTSLSWGGGCGGGAGVLSATAAAPMVAGSWRRPAATAAVTAAASARLALSCASTTTTAAGSSNAAVNAPLPPPPPQPQPPQQQQPSSSSSSSSSPSYPSTAAGVTATDADADDAPARPPPPPPSSPARGFVFGGHDVASFPPHLIRNFCIIAHVDHGKSTLADRLMEMTGALGGRATHNAQYLDKLQVERERGITVKAQTVSLVYEHRGVSYLLNLIDTPGHVDFSYEVSRSLAACQGALLVVDAGQGIQAQTVANFYLAFEQGLDLIPLVNKIDLPAADPRGCADQMAAAFDLEPGGVLFTSAKTGQGMEAVLPAVVERIRPPRGDPGGPLRMLLFDAFHDDYRGVVLLVAVVDGAVQVGQRVAMAFTGASYEVQEVGLQAPERYPTGRLLTGQVGYLLCGIKDLKAARVGDTLYAAAAQPGGQLPPAAVPPRLPGFKPAKAMVFAGLFPLGGDGQEFESLATAMDKLLLNDASVVVKRENSEALGPGFRCGFLGMLHMEIFTQRLQHEYGASVVTTTPMVPYVLEMPDGSTTTLESASEYPVDKRVAAILEPTVTATLIAPDACLGRLMELCAGRRGEQLEHASLGGGRTLLRYRLPLAELAGDFYSAVKSRSQGYASFDYEEGPYRPADLVRLDIMAHGQPVDALARMVPRGEAAAVGRALLVKMKEALDRQQFEVVLQAAANGKIVARETIKALRKNVTAKCYGGDVSRKRKLLERQKEGKRRMKRLGTIDVPQELFPELMKTRW